jgi:hypothetical protein
VQAAPGRRNPRIALALAQAINLALEPSWRGK